MVFMLPTHTGNRMPAVSRKSYARLPQILEVPNLIRVQLDSFRWFQEMGLMQLLEAVSPIKDFTGNRLELSLFMHNTTNVCSLLAIGAVKCDVCGKTIRHGDRYCYRSDRGTRYGVDCGLNVGYLRSVTNKKTGEVYPAMFVLKDEEIVRGDTASSNCISPIS